MHQRLRSCCPESHRLFCLAHLSSVRGLLYWQGVAVWRGERGPAACVRDGCWGDLHDLGHRGTTHRGRTHQALLPGDVHTVPTQTASVPQEVNLLLLDYVMFTFFFTYMGLYVYSWPISVSIYEIIYLFFLFVIIWPQIESTMRTNLLC